MTIDKRTLLAGAAVIAALGIGFAAARLSAPNGADGPPKIQTGEGGEHVEGPEGFVALKAADAAAAGVQIVGVGRGGGVEIMLPGRVGFAPNARASVGAPVAGRVVMVHVAAGDAVSAGAAIATLASAEGASARASLDAARASAEAARTVEARESRLLAAGVVARQDWEAARAASLKAQAELRAAQAQTALAGSPGRGGATVVRSPIRGVVTRVATAPGAVLAAGGEMVEIADPSRIEIVFDAQPAALDAIVPGARIEAVQPNGRTVSTIVTGVAPGLAGAGGTVRARPVGAAPPAGTVISGRMVGAGGGARLTVPSDAVQTIEGSPMVFVVTDKGFQARPVTIGARVAGATEILSGLDGHERIAGQGAFLLKAELAKGQTEHGH